MLRLAARRPFKPIALATAVGTAGYWIYSYSASQKAIGPKQATFDIPVRAKGPDGKTMVQQRPIAYLAAAEVERKLTENAFSTTLGPRPGGLLWKYDTAFLASNDPIEDANAQSFLRREEVASLLRSQSQGEDQRKRAEGDLLFFAVMDGHAGYYTSRLLAKTLIPTVALELSTLASVSEAGPSQPARAPSSFFSYLKSFIWSSHSASGSASIPKNTAYPYDSDPTYIKTAIQTAFANLDSQIVNTPIKLVTDLANSSTPLDVKSAEFQLAVGSLLPALSGACALLTVVDTANQDLYVACTGDSRAVAGYWDEDKDGNGKWRVEVLTEDQTGRNVNELRRMQSEHPPDEASYVIQRGRVLGGLEPTRAFGDARYKWSRDFQQKVAQLLQANGEPPRRGVPMDLKTPPYVTSRPEITHRKLNLAGQQSESRSGLKFIVMATDGLWDQLSSEEVVSLVGEYLNRSRLSPMESARLPKAIPKKELAKTTVLSSAASGVDGKSAQVVMEREKTKLEGSWAFVDNNVSTHLIRNAFGGADEDKVRRLLSIPAPMARSFRDDITVTVVWYENEDGSNRETGHTKSKL